MHLAAGTRERLAGGVVDRTVDHDVPDGRQVRQQLGERRGQGVVDHDDLVLGVVGHVRQLLGEQPDVEGVQDGAGARHGEVRLEVLVVPHEGGDPLVAVDPRRRNAFASRAQSSRSSANSSAGLLTGPRDHLGVREHGHTVLRRMGDQQSASAASCCALRLLQGTRLALGRVVLALPVGGRARGGQSVEVSRTSPVAHRTASGPSYPRRHALRDGERSGSSWFGRGDGPARGRGGRRGVAAVARRAARRRRRHRGGSAGRQRRWRAVTSRAPGRRRGGGARGVRGRRRRARRRDAAGGGRRDHARGPHRDDAAHLDLGVRPGRVKLATELKLSADDEGLFDHRVVAGSGAPDLPPDGMRQPPHHGAPGGVRAS